MKFTYVWGILIVYIPVTESLRLTVNKSKVYDFVQSSIIHSNNGVCLKTETTKCEKTFNWLKHYGMINKYLFTFN